MEPVQKKLKSNSVGNQYKFNQQLPKKKKEISGSELTAKENLREIQIVNQLDSLYQCCAIGGELGCCLKHFVDENTKLPDYDKALQYVKENRIVSKEASTAETRDPLIISIFKNCISNDTFRGQDRIFEMDYRIPSTTKRFGRDNSIKCCLKTIYAVYGISEHEWKKTSKAFKECAAGENVTTLHHKPYTDKTLHDYSYEKAAQVFEDNVGYTGQE
jgi:hypothetical protein